MLYAVPEPDLEDRAVLDEVHEMRARLGGRLRAPRRWLGGLRRTTQALAIQGSNTIEGYTVTDDDALAAVDDEQPLSADERTWVEIVGYRRVLTYIVQMSGDPAFQLDAQTLRSLHFMLLEHDLTKRPGRYRDRAVYVMRESDGRVMYEGPDSDRVPALVDELVESPSSEALAHDDAMVRAAMAHLNLVMIHPFHDGNGRMARAVQTLLLAQDRVLEPEFASIEEWLGRNTVDYYNVLSATGRGHWSPHNDAHAWLKFNLRAHHMQAQTLRRRIEEADLIGAHVLDLIREAGLPERTFDPLFDSARGLRVRRPTYVKRSGIEERTATRDLKSLVDAGLLVAHGATRGRFYTASGRLLAVRNETRHQRKPLDDPYPWLIDEITKTARQERALLRQEGRPSRRAVD